MTAVARRTAPSTSHEAAWSLRDLNELQGRVLALLNRLHDATDEILVDAYEADYGPVSPSPVRPRRRELQDLGALVGGGRSHTKGGRPCQVFRAAPSTTPRA